MNDSLSTWIPFALHTTHTLLPISSPNERIFNKHNNHNDSTQSNTANRWLDSSRPNPEQTPRIDQTLYACSPATVRKHPNHRNAASLLARQQTYTLSSYLFTKRHLTPRTAENTLLHAIDNSIISNTLHSHDSPNANRNS